MTRFNLVDLHWCPEMLNRKLMVTQWNLLTFLTKAQKNIFSWDFGFDKDSNIIELMLLF